MTNTLAFHIAALYRDFLKYTTEKLKKMGLNFGQMPLIVYVGKHPNCTQAELTRNIKLDWGYSQRCVKKLVDGGFLQKKYSKGSACNCLELTENGMKAFEVCHKVFEQWDEDKTAAFGSEEKQCLLQLLSKLNTDSKEDVN